MPTRPAAGGGRWVDVDPARLPRWLSGFADRHGESTSAMRGDVLTLVGADGSVAELHPPPGAPASATPYEFVVAAQQPRRVGLLIARQAAVAVGIADGDRLTASKVDSSYVQGRTAAGGWSQHRFARRRANQAKAAAGAAAEIVAQMLLPQAKRLHAVVCGGDRRAVDAVLADPRLAPVAALKSERFLDLPEPRLVVLQQAVPAARAIRVRVIDAQ